VVKRAERKGINPKTKEEIVIPAKKVVRFKPGKKLELV
jgi:DNA-binding protein HU-beta